jgi:hypothetical protein
MWTVAPQRDLHSAGICFRRTNIRETFADGGSLVPLFYSNVGPATFLRFRILSYAISPLFSVFQLHICELKTPSFISG